MKIITKKSSAFALSIFMAAGIVLPAYGAPAQEEKRPDSRKTITVAKPGLSSFDIVVSIPGTVFAKHDLVLFSENAGKAKRLGVEEGQQVKAGQDIAGIDSDLFKSQMESAKAQHDLAASELKRNQELHDNSVISADDFEAFVAKEKSSKATFEVARINFEKSSLTAPFDGVVDRYYVEDNEFVNTGVKVARIIDLSTFQVRCFVPEMDVSALQKGKKVNVRHLGLEIAKQGTITHVSLAADKNNMAFPVKVEGQNTAPMFLAGMIVEVDFVKQHLENVVVVDLFCIMKDKLGTYVFVEKDGKAVRRDVKIGVVQDGKALISAGLKPDDRLIAVGQRDLIEGDLVRIVEER